MVEMILALKNIATLGDISPTVPRNYETAEEMKIQGGLSN